MNSNGRAEAKEDLYILEDKQVEGIADMYSRAVYALSLDVQGIRKKLPFSRAILADPKVLTLDEATSSVGTRTEILIQTALDELMKGRTRFIIAHRLSTIRKVDLILCMNHGDIRTRIMQRINKEFYAELYNGQFEHPQDALI